LKRVLLVRPPLQIKVLLKNLQVKSQQVKLRQVLLLVK
jgi:hypothetical protein